MVSINSADVTARPELVPDSKSVLKSALEDHKFVLKVESVAYQLLDDITQCVVVLTAHFNLAERMVRFSELINHASVDIFRLRRA